MAAKETAAGCSPEVRERAVRLAPDGAVGHGPRRAAAGSTAAKTGRAAETPRRWVRQAGRGSGRRAGPAAGDRDRIGALEREGRGLRQANGILRKASAHLAPAGLGRRSRP